MDATEQKVAAQAQVTRQLRDQREAAARAAVHVEPCESPKTCEAVFQAVTAPALRAGRIAQAELVGAALSKDLGRLRARRDDERGAALIAQTYNQRAREVDTFDRQSYNAVIDATRNAIAALEPHLDSDRSGILTKHTERMKQSIANWRMRSSKALHPPEALQPPGADLGEVTIRR
jgi:sigma54-dependent transcription regulator